MFFAIMNTFRIMSVLPSLSTFIFIYFLLSVFSEEFNTFSISFVFYSAGLGVISCIPITVVIYNYLNFV